MAGQRFPAVFEPLDQAADAIIAQAEATIHVRYQICAALADGVGYVANAMGVMRSHLADRGYGPEITEPISQAEDALRAAAHTCGDGESAVLSLMNMTVGELAASQRQAPNQSELNGGN